MSAKSENRAMKRQRASKRASIYEPLEGRVLMCYEPHDVAPLPQNPSLENAPPAQTQSAAARTGGGGETYAPDGGTPFNIVWTNRGLASDNFAATFGGNANLARGVVDEDAAHGLGRRPEEPRAVGLEHHQVLVQPEVGFVDQFRGLERVPRALVGHADLRDGAKLIVDLR